MKILLQQTGTGLVRCQDGAWTSDERKALIFESSLTALDYCVQNGVRDAEIALRFEDRRFDVHLRPFGPPQPGPSSASAAEALSTVSEQNKTFQEPRQSLASEIDSIVAQGKERRKRRPFKGKRPENGKA